MAIQPSFQKSGFAQPHSLEQVEAEQKRFIWRVYRWMTVGLGLSGGVALFTASSEAMLNIVLQPFVMYGLLIAELIMVWSFSAVARRASAAVAAGLFLSYAAVNGLTLAIIFLIYTKTSIAQVFFVTTGTFAAMSLYGWATKRDLTSVGSFCMMGLIGVIIAGVVNIFVRSDMLGFMLSCAGVVVFVGLTAYDTQKIKELNIIGNEGTDEDTKEALHGALVLYLDFINLFLYLLRLLGKRR
jgi:FtsH-binding integral membrane protein